MNRKQHKQSDDLFYQAVVSVITEWKERDPITFKKFISTPENHMTKKIAWLKNKKDLLLVFFKLLKTFEMIEEDYQYEFFRNHFLGTDSFTDKIKWMANTNEVVYLFHYLTLEKIIEKVKHPHSQLCEHFIDQYGQPLKSETLRTLLNKGINDAKRESVIEKIIKELVKG